MSGKRSAPSKSAAKRPRTRKQKVLRLAKWLGIAFLAFALVAVGGFVVLYKMIDIPDPNQDFLTQTSKIYYADGKTELGDFAVQNRDSITLEEMPEDLQDAVVAAENRTFWTDKGIDPKGIIRAAFSNASGNSTQGASTITQQYVKILYLSQERSYKRKVKEAILSLKVQREQSKSEILRGYLNTIYFGRGAYGVQAAAQAYFDKDAKDLDLKESAVLASVLNNPTHFDPANGKQSKHDLHERYDYVLDGMADAGNITQDEADKAKKHLPKFPPVKADSRLGGQRGHMLTMVRDELHHLGYSDEQIDGGGLRVTTTFTPKAMDAAKQGVVDERPEGFGDKQLHIAVASVEPGTGALRGFYGGQDYLDSQINWAVTGGSPGSSFKPFALATGLKAGFSLTDTFDGDSPYYYNGEGTGDRVRNEGSGPDGLGTDYGSAVSLLYATEESINTAYADLTMSIPDGPQKILDTANAAGIPKWDKSQSGFNHLHTSPGLEPISGIALGSATVAPVNMANAYATIANGGEAADVHVIEKVVDEQGGHNYTWKQHTTPAFDADDEQMNSDIAADTSYALQQVVKSGTGQNALALGRPAAGKTGTATNGDDEVSSSWFVGYTPQLATAVMYVRGKGNEQLDGWLPSYFGADYPTRTWTAVMRADMEGLPVEEFPLAANLDGEAPDTGHEPAPPPPTRTRTAQPSSTPSTQTSSAPPSSQSPSESPTESPSDSCGLLGCGSSSSTPSPSDTASSPTGSPSGPGGGHTRGRRGRRRTPVA
ncbi:transglycosylase domain-containing protein [Nocardioides sp. HB32]